MTGRALRHPTPGFISRAALVGLGVVLAAVSAHAVVGEIQQRDELSRIRRALVLSDDYATATLGVTQLDLHALRFLSDPTPEHRATFEAALPQVLSAFEHIHATGFATDRALVEQLNDEHLPSLAVVMRFFDSVASGTPFNEELPSADTVSALLMAFETLSDQRRMEAFAALDARVEGSNERILTTLTVHAMLLAATGLLVWAFREYSRRDVHWRVEVARLREAVLTDSLTGLHNHRAFHEQLPAALEATLASHQPLSLAIVDVDGFKAVNDTWGHARGDTVLLEIAQLLRRTCSLDDEAYRIGGDEFALLLHAPAAEALERLHDLREAATSRLDGVSLSLGVAAVDPSGPIDSEALRAQADAALHDAKQRGRNAVVAFVPGGGTGDVSFASAKVRAVLQLLSRGEIEAAFQPIWNVHTGELYAFEALARPAPDSGLDGPYQAFSIAARIGKSPELDAIARRAALARAHELPPELLLFLNMSPETLVHSSFSAAALVLEVRAAGLDPARVVIEVTERATVPIGVVEQRVRELRGYGFGVALDDVGAGNAGLEMLRRVPVDVVKIDRAVLTSALDGQVGRAVLLGVVAFATEAHATIIAEGIEDAAMLALVTSLGGPERGADTPRVHAGQGFLLGRPGPTFDCAVPDVLAARTAA